MSQQQRLLTYLETHPKGILNIEMQSKLWILNYTGRLSDLKRDGHDVRCQKVLTKGKYRGINRYYLEKKPTNIFHTWFKKGRK